MFCDYVLLNDRLVTRNGSVIGDYYAQRSTHDCIKSNGGR